MDFFRLVIVRGGGAECADEQFDRGKSTITLDENYWNEILRTSYLCGAMEELKEKVQVFCGVCGNFIVPARDFLNFVEKLIGFTENLEEFDQSIIETLWTVNHSLIETKFNDIEKFKKYWEDGAGADNLMLLRDKKGDLIFDEITGWPVGLAYADVAVKLYTNCQSCEAIFR